MTNGRQATRCDSNDRRPKQMVARLMLGVYLGQPMLGFAQIVAAPTATDGRRPYIDQTQNGLPKVNIATPNGAGVSHNVYQDLNVAKQGAILNNGATNSSTRLAGWVEGNPNLRPGQEAKLILNEVIGGKPSQLQGFLEIAGKPADLVIANESGVTCNGCGFINTTRTTLTTGQPLFNAAGGLDQLAIRRGEILIGQDGLSAADSQIDLLSHAINIQGKINADRLKLVAGSNDVRYADTGVVRQAGGAIASIDVSRLGGMYANQIDLIATGGGVGVRIDGTLVSAGNVSIQSDGLLSHAGQTSAAQQLVINADAVNNTGALVATGDLELHGRQANNAGNIEGRRVLIEQTAGFEQTASGKLGANENLQISTDAIVNQGEIAVRGDAALGSTTLVNNGVTNVRGQLTIDGQRLENAGTLSAGSLQQTADSVVNLGAGTIAIEGEAVLHGTNLNNLGQIRLNGPAVMDVRRLNNAGVVDGVRLETQDTWRVDNSGSLTAQEVLLNTEVLSNTGRLEGRDHLVIRANDVSNQSGIIASHGVLDLQSAQTLDNRSGLILNQGEGATQVVAGRTLDNRAGAIEGQGASLLVQAGDLDNSDGQIAHTAAPSSGTTGLSLRAEANAAGGTGQLRNVKGRISGTGDVEVRAAALITDPTDVRLSQSPGLNFQDKATAVSDGTTHGAAYDWESDIAQAQAVVNAKAALDQATQTVTQTAALLQTAQADQALAAQNKQSTAAQLNSAAAAKATAESNAASASAAAAADPGNATKTADAASATAQLATAQQTWTSAQAADTTAASSLIQAQQRLDSANNANQTAQSNLTAAQAAYTLAQAAVKPVENGTTGTVPAQPDNKPAAINVASPTLGPLSVPQSDITAAKDLTVVMTQTSGLLDNRQGKLAAGNNLTVQTPGDVLAGQMSAGQVLTVNARQIDVDQQLLGDETRLAADTLNVAGKVQGNTRLQIAADNLTNSGVLTAPTTQISGRQNETSLNLGNSGLIQGDKSLMVSANQVLNTGTLASQEALSLTANTQLENTALIYSGGNLNIYGKDLFNNQGRFYALGDLSMLGDARGAWANSILNYAGRIEAQGNLDLAAQSIVNRSILPSVNIRGVVTRTDDGTRIISQAKDTFNADGKLAQILSAKRLRMTADEIHNEYGVLSGQLEVALNARSLTNRSYGAIQTQNMVVRGACFNCHQTVKYHDSWGGVIESAGPVSIVAQSVNNLTTDTRDGFAGLGADPRAVLVDERAGSQSPLTKAFIDRFGFVNGPGATTGLSGGVNLPGQRRLSDNVLLNERGDFDFSKFVLPDGKTGLFQRAADSSPYLIRGRTDLYSQATDSGYIQYNQFLGSDYLLSRLGFLPMLNKLIGDAWYETQLVQDQLYALTGRKYLVAGTDSDYDLMRGLMDAGLLAKSTLGLAVGMSLSPAQQAALTGDIVWPEWQMVDGQKVLVPKVYLAHKSDSPQPAPGALIAGSNVAITTRDLKNKGSLAAEEMLSINAAGVVNGGGSYSGGKAVAIVAGDIDLESARINSGGWLNLAAQNDLTLSATQVSAKDSATLSAGGDLNLSAKKLEAQVVRADGTTRHDIRYDTTNLDIGGNLSLRAGQDITMDASKIGVGKDLQIEAVNGSIALNAVTDSSDYTTRAAQRRTFPLLLDDQNLNIGTSVHEETLKRVEIAAGGSASLSAAQNIQGSAVKIDAQSDINLKAGKQLTLNQATATQSRTDTSMLYDTRVTAEGETETTPMLKQQTATSVQTVGSEIRSGGSIKAVSGQMRVAGQLTGQEDIALAANEGIALQGGQTAGRDIQIIGGDIALVQNQQSAGRDIKLQGDNLGIEQSSVSAGSKLDATANQNIAVKNSTLNSGADMNLNAGGAIGLQGAYNTPTQIGSGQNLNITALGGIEAQAVAIQAADDLNLTSLGDISIVGIRQTEGGGNHIRSTTQKSSLSGDNVSINALQGSVNLAATDVTAADKLKVSAGQDINIISGENYAYDQWTTSSTSGPWYNKKTTTTTHTVESTVQVPSILSGGNQVDISAGNNLTTLASQVNSGGDVNLSAGGKIDYLAAVNINRQQEDSKTSRSFAGISMGSSSRNDSTTTVKAAPTQLQSESDILSESGGDTRLQGTQIKAGGSFTANAGVGPSADPNARILIEGVKEKTIESHTEQDENLVWQSMSGHGSTQESLALVKIDAKDVKFSAPGGISVQLPASDNFRQQIEALQQEPGMGWLGDLAQRKDVNWSQVKLAYDSWSYSQQGLSQTGAVLVAIAVAAVTYGAASGLSTGLAAGAGMTTSAGAAGASAITVGTAGGVVLTTGGAMLSTALAAGMSSLASQAAVALINNQGDIGKTLQTLGSESSIRNTVAVMVTAGTLQGLGDALGFSQNVAYNGMSGNGSLATSTSGVVTDQFVNQLGANLSKNIVNNLTGTLINSTITGKPLNEQSLQTALTSAIITTGIAQGANDIGKAASKGPNGEAPAINGFTQAVAHVVLGCAGGAAAAGNSSGCGAGAIGGVVGELTAKFASDANMSPDSAVALAKVMSATAGLLVSGGDATQVNVAATMGANAAVNNFLVEYKLKGMGSAYVDDQFAPKLEQWIQTAKAQGVDLTFNEAFRTTDYQSGLANNPNAITPAKAGSSLHEAGFAVDVNYSSLKDIPGGLTGNQQRQIILDTAKEAGLSWGGNFTKPDYPHFYYDPGGRVQKIIDAQRTYCEIKGGCK